MVGFELGTPGLRSTFEHYATSMFDCQTAYSEFALSLRGTDDWSKCTSCGRLRFGRGLNSPLCRYVEPYDSQAWLAPREHHNALASSIGQDIDRRTDRNFAWCPRRDRCNCLILEDLDVPFD